MDLNSIYIQNNIDPQFSANLRRHAYLQNKW